MTARVGQRSRDEELRSTPWGGLHVGVAYSSQCVPRNYSRLTLQPRTGSAAVALPYQTLRTEVAAAHKHVYRGSLPWRLHQPPCWMDVRQRETCVKPPPAPPPTPERLSLCCEQMPLRGKCYLTRRIRGRYKGCRGALLLWRPAPNFGSRLGLAAYPVRGLIHPARLSLSNLTPRPQTTSISIALADSAPLLSTWQR